MSALAYHRMPGFGDLAGDVLHPGSPDYVEPEYGEDDAEGDVALALAEADEVGALVSDVRGALPALRWVSTLDVPSNLAPALRILERKAAELDRLVNAQRELMGRAA